MKSILPYSILIPLTAACVPSGEFVDFKDGDFTTLQSESTQGDSDNAELFLIDLIICIKLQLCLQFGMEKR